MKKRVTSELKVLLPVQCMVVRFCLSQQSLESIHILDDLEREINFQSGWTVYFEPAPYNPPTMLLVELYQY